MHSNRSIEENYGALLELPIIKRLISKNYKLRKENKALKSLIYSLPEFRCECRNRSPEPNVDIKIEKEESILMPCEPLAETDEVVYVANPDSDVKKINIVYEIQDECDDSVDEESESESEEEEEGADAVEAEAEEEEEEEGADAVDEEGADAVEAEDADAVEEEEEGADAVEAEAEEDEGTDAVEEEAEEEDEVFEISISGKSYYTTNKENGKIYAIDADEEIGDEIGEFKAGKAKFYKK